MRIKIYTYIMKELCRQNGGTNNNSNNNNTQITYQFVCYVQLPHSHPSNLGNKYQLQLVLSSTR